MALQGVRVLDLTRYIPGPYCTMLLGDLGADVVKVEDPQVGDPTRYLPPVVGTDSAAHAALNRNKRSVAVDIRKPEGAALVRRLAAGADVLVESFRPRTLERRGLGPEALTAANPRLVYCSLSGYGSQGPLAARAGHDVNYAALGGFLGGNRDAGGRPVLPPVQVADMTGGFLATIAVLAALQARERTGCGQVVEISLLEAVRALLTFPATRHLAGGGPFQELTGRYACYNLYACRDGQYVSVGALEPKFWEALCRRLGLAELVGQQWASGKERMAAIEKVAAAFASRDRGDWLQALEGVEACVEPVLDLEEALAEAGDALVTVSAGGVSLRVPRTPFTLSATPAALRREPPGLGQHTGEVLAEAGLSSEDVERLRVGGVVA